MWIAANLYLDGNVDMLSYRRTELAPTKRPTRKMTLHRLTAIAGRSLLLRDSEFVGGRSAVRHCYKTTLFIKEYRN